MVASRVEGLRVFLTGASSGIGEALARCYAAQGAQLGLVARRGDKLAALLASLPGGAERHALFVADVSDPLAMRTVAEQFMSRFGPPDVLIANAGISVGTLTEFADDFDAIAAVFATNVLGVVATFQPFVRSMRGRGTGALVAVSSIAGVRGLPGAGAYCASKSAVSRYLESLRVELHGSGLSVTDVRPGYIATPMTAVNEYRMPFMLSADKAAVRIVDAIGARRRRITLPWQMAIVARLLPFIPTPLYDAILSRARRKPRKLAL